MPESLQDRQRDQRGDETGDDARQQNPEPGRKTQRQPDEPVCVDAYGEQGDMGEIEKAAEAEAEIPARRNDAKHERKHQKVSQIHVRRDERQQRQHRERDENGDQSRAAEEGRTIPHQTDFLYRPNRPSGLTMSTAIMTQKSTVGLQ